MPLNLLIFEFLFHVTFKFQRLVSETFIFLVASNKLVSDKCSKKKKKGGHVGYRARFKGERSGNSPRGFHKTEIESTDFIETIASLKLRKVSLHFYLL
jgi:hypothetical protein